MITFILYEDVMVTMVTTAYIFVTIETWRREAQVWLDYSRRFLV